MWDLLARIIAWAWNRKDLRPHVISLSFALVFGSFCYLYVNVKHAEAMAEIRDAKSQVSHNSFIIQKISEDVAYTRGRVDAVTKLLLNRR